MLLSEMLGVERDTDFCVEMFEGKFRIMSSSGRERLFFKSDGGDWGAVTAAWMLYGVIESAPSGIIHLPPPLTDEQREQLRAIWTLGGRWIAKDMPGDTFAFGYKPVKDMEWLSWMLSNDDKGENLFSIYRDFDVCNLVSWSDPEPYDIGKALGV